jgi:hypothetical protein
MTQGDVTQEIGFGLWEVQQGPRLTREIRDLAKFRRAVGDDLVVGLVQLFTAVGRLDAFHVLILLNARPSPPNEDRPETAHDPDSAGSSRNRIVLASMIWGVFHELNDAVESLKSARLTEVLTTSKSKDTDAITSWKALRKIAGRWQGPLETIARNEFAYHLGGAGQIRKGLDRWPADEALILSTSDHASRAHTSFHIGFDLSCRGLDVSPKAFLGLVDQAIADARITDDVMRVFFGVLHAKGAPIPSATAIGRTKVK